MGKMKNLLIEELNFINKCRQVAEPSKWTVKSNHREENRTLRASKAARYVPQE